jgi:hypothetical protein
LNELIGSTKEVIENQDSIVQQLDKYIDQMHRGGTGEVRSECPPTFSVPISLLKIETNAAGFMHLY